MTYLRIPRLGIVLLTAMLQTVTGLGQESRQSAPLLGSLPPAPKDVSDLPGAEPRKQNLSAGFNVNIASREEVRQFFNSVYLASDNIPIDSTAIITNCFPGTNSAAFLTAELWRINWFRAMSGIPAAVTFSASENVEDQAAAVMMSANNEDLHTGIPANSLCFSSTGTNASANSDLALGFSGADAITGYIWDYGAANAQVGHRRWMLYPQTQVMAGGDVPAQGTNLAANATWIFDANLEGPRPATRSPFVAWPPPGYVPYPVVFPQWSFALSNADFSVATVTMQSNGVPLGIILQPYEAGAGEDSVVWYPANLDPTSFNTDFPFNGADTTYAITISNVRTVAGPLSFTYNVTVFDPDLPGADSVPTAVRGTNRPSVNENNPYTCTPSANPNTTGYQWLTAQLTNGNLTDNALNGLTNFTISPVPLYAVITNPPVGSGKCFHLTHTNPVPQFLQFAETLFPATNTTLSFSSLLGYATTNEVARVQVSTNGSPWMDLFTQTGTGTSGQTAFASHTLALSNYAGQITTVRFNYDLTGGSYFPQTQPNTGWCLEKIVITNTIRLINFATNATASTNFNFVPTQTGNWVMEAQGIIFNQFGLEWSAANALVVVTNPAPTLISLGFPALANGQAQIPFTVTQGAASTFQLLQAGQITGPWTTNTSAVLSTITPGNSFQFTTPAPSATTFYRLSGH